MQSTDVREEKLKGIEKLAYGSGAAGMNVMFMYISSFMLFFYTDIFGISAKAAGLIFLISKLVDAAFDIWLGYAIDRTQTKWGKLRPYILFGAVPYAVAGILAFSTPNLGETGKIIYALITFILVSMMYSVINISHGALNTVMTSNQKERGVLTGQLLIFSAIAGILGTALPQSIIGKFSDPQTGYQVVAVGLSVLSVVLLWFCFAKVKERIQPETNAHPKKVTFRDALKVIKTNTPLMIVSLAFVFVLISSAIKAAVTLYYFTYNLGNPELFGLFTLCKALVAIIAMYVVSKYIMKIGKRNLFIWSGVVGIVTNLGCYYMTEFSLSTIIVLLTISGVANGLSVYAAWAMIPDTVEYAAVKTGIRAEGSIYAIFAFLQKLAQALGGALPAFLLAGIGYVANAEQTPATLDGLKDILFIYTSVMYLAFIIVIYFYRLDRKK